MPGLVRGVARTAAIAGTATAVSNRVSRRQAGRWSEQDAQAAAAEQQQAAPPAAYAPPPQAYAPPPAAPAADPNYDSKLAQLQQLGELKAQGILSEAEFEIEKHKILAG
jgi:Short C-terminal domain